MTQLSKKKIGIYEDVTDSGLLLEMLTSEIRAHSISIGKLKARRRREEERRAFAELIKCESDMCTNPQDEYQILKESVDGMQMEKGKKAMLWTGIRWMEEGEKPSRYFLNLCASKAAKKPN